MKKTWKPTAGGILAIVIGVFGGLLFGLAYSLDPHNTGGAARFGVMALVLGIIAIIGGVFVLRRRVYRLASWGAICALLSGLMAGMAVIAEAATLFLRAEHFVPLVVFGVLGILAIVFTYQGKGEFE